MKLHDHYLTLLNKWGPSSHDVYIRDIATTMKRSIRHTKMILKQLQQAQWITWLPGSGRGNPSKLSLNLSKEALYETIIRQYIEQGNIKHALQLMEEAPLQQSFIQWLEKQFHWRTANTESDGIDKLCYPYYFPIDTLNPMYTITRHEGHLGEHIFNRLLRYNHDTHTFDYELLHHFTEKENGRVWHFYLRKGVLFHDGSRLTTHIVKENITLWQKTFTTGWLNDMLQMISTIEIHSDYIMTIHLCQTNRLFPHVFTGNRARIISTTSYGKDPDRFQQHPIGTGPYQVDAHHDGYIQLSAFDHYFGLRPQLDQIELYHIPNHKRGHRQVDYRIVREDTKHMKHYDWHDTEIGGTYLVVNRQKQGWHTHPEFPKMLSYALDREALFADHPHYNVWFPDSFFERSPATGPLRQKSHIEKARKWFSDQGFVGKSLTLISTCLSHNAHLGYELSVLKEALETLGIDLHTDIVDINELTHPSYMSQADLIIAGIGLGEDRLASMLNFVTDKTSFIYTTLPTTTRLHVDALLNDIFMSASTKEAYQKMRLLERFLLDHYDIILLYDRKTHVHIEADHRLQGVEINRYNRLRYDQLWYQI
ncbi:ABC transporter substrate-binding protein [Bacillus sp. FSL W7-1360]